MREHSMKRKSPLDVVRRSSQDLVEGPSVPRPISIRPAGFGHDIRGLVVTPQMKRAVDSDDVHEAEADAMADSVIHMPAQNLASHSTGTDAAGLKSACDCPACSGNEDKRPESNANLQDTHSGESYTTGSRPGSVQQVVQTGGQPLDRDARAFMEPRFGRDFSSVRIHSDPSAGKSAEEEDALAYTVGNHVAFRSGHYSPQTDAGLRLLAHELTHVVQQGAAPTIAGVQHQKTLSRVDMTSLQRKVVCDEDGEGCYETADDDQRASTAADQSTAPQSGGSSVTTIPEVTVYGDVPNASYPPPDHSEMPSPPAGPQSSSDAPTSYPGDLGMFCDSLHPELLRPRDRP